MGKVRYENAAPLYRLDDVVVAVKKRSEHQ